MKIGIISELNCNNVNYGNRLQAYALNTYLNETKKIETFSIIYNGKKQRKWTSISISLLAEKILNRLNKKLNKTKVVNYNKFLKIRENNCNIFTKEKIKIMIINNIEEFKEKKFDILIVGSDVVWGQNRSFVNKLKFLEIPNCENVKKISYAASFGKDWIPNENKKIIKKYLKEFKQISVREYSTVSMLDNIGINNVEHVCDPTLLLSKKEWQILEEKPNIKLDNKYIFTYLLGKDCIQRDFIKTIAQEKNLKIINIPHANGIYSEYDNNFADYNIDNCSPEEWLYLINHSEYVFTDSFHGTVLSTIFEKKFFVLSRNTKNKINNRMLDYLKKINQKDKFIEDYDNFKISKYEWNYANINMKLNEFIDFSKKYLNNAILSKKEK